MSKNQAGEVRGDVIARGDPVVQPDGTMLFPWLNDNQNRFLGEWVRNGQKPLLAYRAVYTNNKMSDNAATTLAYQILQRPGVRLALAEIQKAAAQVVGMDLASHLNELAILRDLSKQARQYSAAISAEVARGKAGGLYVQRVELTGKDGNALGITNVPMEDYLKAREQILQEC